MPRANLKPLATNEISELSEINQLTREIQLASAKSDWVRVGELAKLRHDCLLNLPLIANDAIAQTLREVLSTSAELTAQINSFRTELQVAVSKLRRGEVGIGQYLAHSA